MVKKIKTCPECGGRLNVRRAVSVTVGMIVRQRALVGCENCHASYVYFREGNRKPKTLAAL